MNLSSDDVTATSFVERDTILRARVPRPPAVLRCEQDLVCAMVHASVQYLAHCPFLVAVEWHVEPGWPQAGIGDLVFCDGSNGFAVVEVKWDPEIFGSGDQRRNRREKSRQKRKMVYEQARKYARAWCDRHAGAKVTAHVCTNVGADVDLATVNL